IVLNLAALGCPRRWVVAAIAAVGVGFALVALLPTAPFSDPADVGASQGPRVSGVVFGSLGLVLVGTIAAVAARLLRDPRTPGGAPASGKLASADGFLGVWLGLEVGACFLLSPYQATGRLLGLVIVGSLLACRLAARTCRGRAGLVWGATAVSLALGLLLFWVDSDRYEGEEVLADCLARECRERQTGGAVWFVGGGAFDF